VEKLIEVRAFRCWCAPLRCHADYLKELVDAATAARRTLAEADIALRERCSRGGTPRTMTL
jgi:hypothetical protein